jgi:hypothetical protein
MVLKDCYNGLVSLWEIFIYQIKYMYEFSEVGFVPVLQERLSVLMYFSFLLLDDGHNQLRNVVYIPYSDSG